MSPRMLDYFKDMLLAEKAKILENLEDEVVPDNPIHQTADLNDAATAVEELERNSHNQARNAKLMLKISQALLRIETEDFGYCRECNEEIGIGRLEARPTAELCIDCKRLEERHEGR